MALYAFDGTWNERKDSGVYGVNTNVVEFVRAYNGQRALVQKPKSEEVSAVRATLNEEEDDFYLAGPGTRHGTLGKWIGGAFGVGGRARIKEAKQAVERRFAEGDEIIDIVGFSRGAALALHFTNELRGDTFRSKNGERVEARVRFLGLWDLVAAFGIPIDLGPLSFQRINLGYKLKLGDHVQYCFHAVALDERRKAFRVTRVDDGYQVWFRGVHSDVGGGNENWKLSNITLAWMLRKAVAAGLPVDGALADRLEHDAAAPVKPASRGSQDTFREVQKNDRIHCTVSPRDVKECQSPPGDCPRESKDDESGRILTTAQLKEEARRAG